MKGLFLKDIYCVRFSTLLGLAITGIPAVMMLFVIGGTAPASADDAATLMAAIPTILGDFLLILLNSSFILNTLGDDNLSGWSKLQLTLPVTKKQIVDSKFISSLIIVGALVLLCLILNIIAGLMYGYPMEICIAAPFVLGAMELIVLFPAFPISMKLSSSMTTVIYIACEVIVIGIMAAIVFCALEAVFPVWLIRALFYGIIPAAAVAVLFISRHFAAKYISVE